MISLIRSKSWLRHFFYRSVSSPTENLKLNTAAVNKAPNRIVTAQECDATVAQ